MQALIYNGPGKMNRPAQAHCASTDRCGGEDHQDDPLRHRPAHPQRRRAHVQTRHGAGQLVTHHFKLAQIVQAYETFGKASETKALKVIIEA